RKPSRSRRRRPASSSPGPPNRAECRPGAPSSASTSRPESSPSVSAPVSRTPARALIRALTAYVSPVSSGKAAPGHSASRRGAKGSSARSAISSAPLARFSVARTSGGLEGERSLVARLERPALQRHETTDAATGQLEHLVQAGVAERETLGGALHLHELA